MQWFKRIPLVLFVMLNPFLLQSNGESQENLSNIIEIKSVTIKRYHFSKIHKDAQMWSAIYVGSNGKVYVGLCTHGDAANVYEFDPSTETMRHLANITELAGERGKGIWTSGKIHVKMQELDGYVYFGSFCEDNGPPVIDAASYRGPHWYRINMETGEVELLSSINSSWGLIGQTMDKKKRLIFGLAEDGRVYKYYIDDDYTECLGKVDCWDICRTIFTDDLGNVYGTYPPGMVWKYDTKQDRIFDFQFVSMPIINQSRSLAYPMLDRNVTWRFIEWDPVDNVAYGIVCGSNMLFKYDVHDGPEGKFTMLELMCAPLYRAGDLMDIPFATLAMTLSQRDRKIYYFPGMSGDFDYGAIGFDVIEQTKFKDNIDTGKLPPLSFLVTYDLKTGIREDVGLLRTEDGCYAWGMGGAQADKQGRIWFVGSFEEKDEEYAVGKMRRGGGMYSMGLGCYDPLKRQ